MFETTYSTCNFCFDNIKMIRDAKRLAGQDSWLYYADEACKLQHKEVVKTKKLEGDGSDFFICKVCLQETMESFK